MTTTLGRRPLILSMLGLAASVCLLVAAASGPVAVPLGDVLASLGRLLTGSSSAEGVDALVSAVRVPRVLMALVVGAGLGVAGAAMQAVFRNPLAEPGITGVSSGAATVAVILIVTGGASSSSWLLPVGAFAGALLAVLVVQAVGLGAGGNSTASLLLVGIALNAFLGAIISAVVANAVNAEDARSAMFWLNGDLTGRTLDDLRLAILPLVLGVAVILFHARDLNLLALGDATAQTSGMNVRRVKHVVLAAAALATAAGVAVTGVISFVGLVVPHLVRLLWGGDHRILLPASALLGGIFLLGADTAARLVLQPVALQTGTVTALLGAPFLLVLVVRVRRRSA
ncbi:iron ABC transporter permease [Tessaracoccus terricola]